MYTEYIDYFPESPPIFELRCVENLVNPLRKLKGFLQKINIIKSTFVIPSLKSKHTKDCEVTTEAPQQATGWCPFLNWKMENGEDKTGKAISENKKCLSYKL